MGQLYLFDDEEWRDVVGYEGLYQVSNLGNVKRIGGSPNRRRDKIIKQCRAGRDGRYMSVCLSRNNKAQKCLVHVLVCKAFHDNPNNLPCVNHKDENGYNNRVENLEWCTYKENDNYGTRNERIALTQSKSINQYTLDGKFVKIWKSIADASRNGFQRSNICQCCKGKKTQHKGYIWKYA